LPFQNIGLSLSVEFLKQKHMKNLVENLNQLFADFTKEAALHVENGNNYVKNIIM